MMMMMISQHRHAVYAYYIYIYIYIYIYLIVGKLSKPEDGRYRPKHVAFLLLINTII